MVEERIQEKLKTRGDLQRTSGQANAQERLQPPSGLQAALDAVTTVTVLEAVQFGDMYICKVEVMSHGAPSGLTVDNVRCYGFIVEGQRSLMVKTGEGAQLIPLATGSAAGAGITTANNTTIVYDVFSTD